MCLLLSANSVFLQLPCLLDCVRTGGCKGLTAEELPGQQPVTCTMYDKEMAGVPSTHQEKWVLKEDSQNQTNCTCSTGKKTLNILRIS